MSHLKRLVTLLKNTVYVNVWSISAHVSPWAFLAPDCQYWFTALMIMGYSDWTGLSAVFALQIPLVQGSLILQLCPWLRLCFSHDPLLSFLLKVFLFFFFLMWAIFKTLLNLLQYGFCFGFLAPRHVGLSFLTKDGASIPYIGR